MRLKQHRILSRSGAARSPGTGFSSAKRALRWVIQRGGNRRIYQSPFPGAAWLVVGLLGVTLAMLCAALTVLSGPGPALVIVPVGLLVLAAQLLWAKKFLRTGGQLRVSWGPQPLPGA